MYWKEDNPNKAGQDSDDIIDLAFSIDCRTLPLDHAHALSGALVAALPWLAEEPRAGIHLIHGAESGNGWYRPEDTAGALMHLSRRTRMVLRLPRGRIEAANDLTGSTLDIDGHTLSVGSASVKPLLPMSTLFARYVVTERGLDEEQFLAQSARQLAAMGIPVLKLLCGRSHVLRGPEGELFVRSVMIADLDKDASLRLQQQGIGPGRMLGCGLFLPHKGIASEKKQEGA